ncbi:nucleotidyltransferase family protein [Desulfovibrio subterraneus]|uniref:Nucleotidyl transferase domain-containing protein n=1 Tax=Desulfovibrio subterraneus TaxID=2718620 RepID=A0A7J0BLD0_9BACT|nr:NDP-sugar synthase [Desulfovibrio subterraneus]GFM34476.1 hypothetical protein DSM101010T_28410 [Desulfovibrio subterraneus]
MLAIIFCNTHRPLPQTLAAHYEFAMLPLANRPVVWHMVEQCVRAGITRLLFVAQEKPEALREQLGNGERWGVSIDVVPPVKARSNEQAQGDFDTDFATENLATLSALLREEQAALIFPALWLCNPEDIAQITHQQKEQPPVSRLLGPHSAAPKMHIAGSTAPAAIVLPQTEPLQLTTVADVYNATMHALDGSLPWLVREEMEKADGIFIGHHSNVHPEATLHPPVIIGPYATIAARCVIGPHAVIGARSIVDSGAEIIRSVLESESYAGSMTYRQDMFSISNMLFSLPDETCILVPDDFLQNTLSKTGKSGQRGATLLRNVTHRGVALLLLLLFWPLPLLLWIAGGFRFRRRVIAGIEQSDSLDCEHKVSQLTIRLAATTRLPRIITQFPALLDVAAGRIALVGPEPVSMEEAASMRHEWERLRFKTKPGLIPPWAGLAPAPLNDVERRTINAWYGRHADLRTDADVLAGLLRRGWPHLRHSRSEEG